MSKKRKQTKGDPRKVKTVRERKEQKYGRFLHLVDGLSSNEVFCLPVAKLSPTEVQRWADALIATTEIGGALRRQRGLEMRSRLFMALNTAASWFSRCPAPQSTRSSLMQRLVNSVLILRTAPRSVSTYLGISGR
ncbi:hypothetical protein HQ400_21425 (plasmid) [Aeromonas jandaei]|nr:hypothetical protein HQ400_21425 [Aeromonas jandaei]